ncbi:uncharacterized protein SOCE836_100990 [Sorangium cellulosum]|uniref:Uncharacterized protein n=1 Tax=Sorangium cellulosum TaxID=56 RepID=A0A4P2R732_SORCE|nr:uncharacterized protein SOCE836_100990 [Sorangium cellulosum]
MSCILCIPSPWPLAGAKARAGHDLGGERLAFPQPGRPRTRSSRRLTVRPGSAADPGHGRPGGGGAPGGHGAPPQAAAGPARG